MLCFKHELSPFFLNNMSFSFFSNKPHQNLQWSDTQWCFEGRIVSLVSAVEQAMLCTKMFSHVSCLWIWPHK